MRIWPNQYTKNISQHLLGAIHLVSYDQFFNPLSLYATVDILHDPASIPPGAHALNGWPISQPKNK